MTDKLLEYFKGDELAASTWVNKYALEGEETPDDMHRRMAKEFARIDKEYTFKDKLKSAVLPLSEYGMKRKDLTEDSIYDLFKDFKYIIPGGSIMATLGSDKLSSLSNCFVIDSPEDSISGIMNQCNLQAQIMKYRGGVGYDISTLRPSGASVSNAAKTSTGAASFMNLFSVVTNTIAQNGRRGALMLTMHINHPDIEQFITMKQDLSKVTGANISVKVTDKFMRAVEEDNDYILTWPIDLKTPLLDENLPYNTLVDYSNIGYVKRVKARELWNKIIECAHNTAEPGIMFIDRIHDYSPDGVYSKYKAISTNPCGEIPMSPQESCKLMHLNLTSFIENPFTNDAKINREKLYEVSYELTRLSDDLVDLEIEAIDRILLKINPNWSIQQKNDYYWFNKESEEFKLWWKIKETAFKTRRIGCGFTGLADAIAMLGLKYGDDTKKSCSLIIDEMMQIIFNAQLSCEIDMAIQRGAFKEWNKELEIVINNSFNKFLYNSYTDLYKKMIKYGRRNISWATVAPTGTVSILAGTSSGIEPLFQPYYMRRRKCMSSKDKVDFIDNVGEKYTEFPVIHPLFRYWLFYHYNWNPNEPEYVDNLSKEELNKYFIESPWYGATANDINHEMRIYIQGIIQRYITHAISSTLNLPKDVTVKEISDIYLDAWKKGLKGITVYRDGSRSGILVNDTKKEETFSELSAIKRPKELPADYYEITVKGVKFLVLVGLYSGRPYEIFVFKPKYPLNLRQHSGKIIKVKKGQYRFDSELIQIDNIENGTETNEEKAHSLLISMLLRHRAPLKFVIKTAKKVDDNITSFSSAMCRVLSKYIPKEETGEICPQCGGKIIHEAGCEKCLNCDYSKCL